MKKNSLDYWKLQFLSYGLYKDYQACSPTEQKKLRRICRDKDKGYVEIKDLLRMNLFYWQSEKRNRIAKIRELLKVFEK